MEQLGRSARLEFGWKFGFLIKRPKMTWNDVFDPEMTFLTQKWAKMMLADQKLLVLENYVIAQKSTCSTMWKTNFQFFFQMRCSRKVSHPSIVYLLGRRVAKAWLPIQNRLHYKSVCSHFRPNIFRRWAVSNRHYTFHSQIWSNPRRLWCCFCRYRYRVDRHWLRSDYDEFKAVKNEPEK